MAAMIAERDEVAMDFMTFAGRLLHKAADPEHDEIMYLLLRAAAYGYERGVTSVLRQLEGRA